MLADFLPLAVSVPALFMGLVVLVSGRGSSRFPFALFSLSMAIWAALISGYLLSSDTATAESIAKLYYIAAAMIIYGFFLFCISFAGDARIIQQKNVLTFLSSMLVVAVSTLVLVPDYFLHVTSVAAQRVVQLETAPYSAYTLYFLVVLVASIFLLVRSLHTLQSSQTKLYQQIKAIAVVTIISIPLGALFNLVLPYFGNYSLIQIGPLFILPIVTTSFYVMQKHELFDIRIAALRTIGYALTLLVLAGIYYAMAYVASNILFDTNNSAAAITNPFTAGIAIILAFLFQPIRRFFDRITDQYFFRNHYNPDDFYSRLSEVLTSTTNLRGLLSAASDEISHTMKADQAFFFVRLDTTHYVNAGTLQHKTFPAQDINELDEYVEQHGDDIIVTELLENDSRSLKRLLASHHIAVLMPLMRRGDLLGYFALGQRKSGDFTRRDINVLSTTSDELVIAIQNALSVQEVKSTNASLAQRIDAATAELRRSNARLKRLDASKDEFLSMASHQLRTPLTSIKGYLSMVLEGDVGDVTPMQKQVLDEAFNSSERMVHLIHDFLNVSRLQTGKFMLEIAEGNLTELINYEIKTLEGSARSRGMTLKFVNHAGDVTFRYDDTKIRQVVMNYIDNAIYYSHPDTTITIELSTTATEVIFIVKDTGIGVPVTEQEHLFSKFYRATNARKQRPDGTGVGLYLAKKIVTALGGDILFESTPGKGSTFGFHLPLKIDEVVLEDRAKQLKE